MISFRLQAYKNAKGEWVIREFYRFPVEKGFIDGMVDDAIRKSHKEIYDPWKASVEANQDKMFEAARQEYLEANKK